MSPLLSLLVASAVVASCQPTRPPEQSADLPPHAEERYEARYRFHRCTGERDCHACSTCVKCRHCHQLGGTCGIQEAKAARR